VTAALLFVSSGLVIVVAGTWLTRYADIIAERSGLGRVWIGTILLAAATSLPEMATDVAAVRLGAPDLAAGDLFGSSMANMLVLAIIDLLPPRRRVLQRVTLDHALAACLAIALNALGAIFVLANGQRSFLGIGPESLVLLLAYGAGTRVVYRHTPSGAPRQVLPHAEASAASPTLRTALTWFGAIAVVILAASPVFAYSAKQIAELTGIGHTFMGTWLVGLSTSLPELVACVAAVRMGAFDLAVGNLFGSNAFNMAVFFAMDVAHPSGSVFGALNPGHALSALFAIVLMALGLGAIVFRSEKRWAGLEPDAVLMLVTYAIGMLMLYNLTGGG
jgi:cation:H+ antiporter